MPADAQKMRAHTDGGLRNRMLPSSAHVGVGRALVVGNESLASDTASLTTKEARTEKMSVKDTS